MGNSSCSLYSNIKHTIKELIFQYELWTQDDICDKLCLIYYNKLIKFNKSDLLNASTAIGIKSSFDNNFDKKKLCTAIINHYKKRIFLLNKICNAVDKGYQQINRAQKGYVCVGTKQYVDDLIVCQKINGLWIDESQYKKIIQNIKNNGGYDRWYSYIQNMDATWKKYTQKLLNIIIKIKKDVDNSINDELFSQIEEEVDLIIKKMNYLTDIYYLLAINYE